MAKIVDPGRVFLTARVLAELLDTKPGKVRALFRQTLGTERSRELKEQMLAAGPPV